VNFYQKLLKINMKQVISIALDEETLKLIESSLKNGIFRNRSHVIEFLINKNLKQENK